MAEAGFHIESTAVQDGKIVAVGYWETDDDSSPFVVARFHSDGRFDESFHGCGIVTTKVGNCDDQAAGVVIQSDGKIVVVGTSYDVGEASEITVLRYRADGTLDLSFGCQGMVRLRLSSGYDQARAVSLRGDGSIIVVGDSGLSPFSSRLFRLDPDGNLDARGDLEPISLSPPAFFATTRPTDLLKEYATIGLDHQPEWLGLAGEARIFMAAKR